MPDSYRFGFGDTLDQAAGLRRLLGCAPLRAVALAGSGATTLTVNLAAALGAAGMDVLVVDENANHGNVSDQLGISARYELIHALHGERALRDVVCEAAAGVRVLPAARGARELARGADARGFSDCLRKAGPVPDLLLIDSANGSVSQLLRGTAQRETVIVAGATHETITAAYGLIKSAAREFGENRFRIIVNRVRDAAEAAAIYRNMAAVARKHAGAELEFLGWMPNDPQCRLARSSRRSVVAACPASPAATALRRLAQRLRNRGTAAPALFDIFNQPVPADRASRDPHPAPVLCRPAENPINIQPWRTAAAVFS